MEARHEMTAHIRKMRPVFYQIGLLTGLLLTLAAFRWTVQGESVPLDIIVDWGEKDSALGEFKIIDEKKPNNDHTKKTKLEIPDPNKKKEVDDKTDVPDTNSTTDDYNPFDQMGSLLAGMPKYERGVEFGEEPPIDVASQMPKFPGGEEAMAKYFQKNYIIPVDILESGYHKAILIQTRCVIEKDGSVSNIEVVKDGGFPDAAAAFVKTIQNMPRWSPGYQGAHAVRVYVAIPMKIRLQ